MKGIGPLGRELCNTFRGQMRRKTIKTLKETSKRTDMPLCNSFSFALRWLIHGVDGSQYRQVLIKSMFTTTSFQRQFVKWSSRPTSAWRIRRCPRGATQSKNEAFNAMIWTMWPKQRFSGAEVVELSAHLAAACFIKHGVVTFLAVLWKMRCTTRSFTESYVPIDSSKVPKESGRLKSRLVRSRNTGEKLWKRRRKGFEENEVEADGQTYEPGAFCWEWHVCFWSSNFVLFGGVRLTPCTITFQPFIVDP